MSYRFGGKARPGSQTQTWLSRPIVGIANLSPVFWLDASDISTITESNNSVSQWNDKSGNNYHVSQATGGFQPTLVRNSRNGLNSVYFDGGDDNLSTSSYGTFAQPLSTFAVFRWRFIANNYRLYGSSGNNQGFQVFINEGKYNAFAGNVVPVGANETIQTACRIVTFNGTNSNFYFNSDAAVTFNAGTNGSSGTFRIGSRADGILFGSFYLNEFAIFDRELSAADRTLLVSYSQQKWGIA